MYFASFPSVAKWLASNHFHRKIQKLLLKLLQRHLFLVFAWFRWWCLSQFYPNLQETKLDLLTPEQCDEFAKDMEANRTHEICAGKKNYFPTIKKFKRLRSAKRKDYYYFKSIGSSVNYLGYNNTKHDFYLGGTDSCQGINLNLKISAAKKGTIASGYL